MHFYLIKGEWQHFLVLLYLRSDTLEGPDNDTYQLVDVQTDMIYYNHSVEALFMRLAEI